MLLLCPFVLLSTTSQVFTRPLTVTLSKTSIAPGEELSITVDSTQPLGYCGVHIYFNGSKEPPILFRIKNDGVDFPYTVKKTFTEPAEIEVLVDGKKVNSAFGCPGRAVAKLSVVGAIGTIASRSTSNQNNPPVTTVDSETLFALGNTLAAKNDDAGALKAFVSAGEKGHVAAMNAAGFMYEQGRGTKQDYKIASSLYLSAMKRGHADAMVNRGLLFQNGLGVEGSKKQAYLHYSLGAIYAKEDVLRDESSKMREEMKVTLSPADLREADREVSRYVKEEIK